MKIKLLTCLVGLVIATAAPLSQAQVGVSIGFNTCNYNGYYQSCAVYAPPVGVYFGGGSWGGDRRGDRHDRHDRHDHHDHH
jgi:hypothetical protein